VQKRTAEQVLATLPYLYRS